MEQQFEFETITERTKELLNRGEDSLVDYKEKVRGLHSEDFVAFANTNTGGVLLVGVKEVNNVNGKQTGEIVGCRIGDSFKLQIMDKALSCSPPVKIEVFLENLSDKPIYRIEIPSGENKPYSTNNGTYKIRINGRNAAIKPNELLKIFIDREGEKFRERFLEATNKLETKISSTIDSVSELEFIISGKIEDISTTLGWAETETGNAKNIIEDVEYSVRKLKRETNEVSERTENINARMKVLIAHLEIEDPIKLREREKVRKLFKEQIESDNEILEVIKKGEKLSYSIQNIQELSSDEMNEILSEVIDEILNNEK